MGPFIYFIMIHDATDWIKRTVFMDSFEFHDWQLNLNRHLTETIGVLGWIGVYAYNVLALIFVRKRWE